jgi:hypothetical protein
MQLGLFCFVANLISIAGISNLLFSVLRKKIAVKIFFFTASNKDD